MPAPLAAGLIRGLIGGAGRGALMTGVRAGARGGIRQGIRSGVRQGVRNTVRGGVGGRGGGGNRGGGRGGQLAKTNDSAITRSENGGLAVQGRTIKEGGALTSSMGPTSQKSSAIVKTGPTKDNVLGLLEQIKQTADQILEVEVKELDNDNKEYKDTKKEQEKERKQLESEKRDEEENKQEEKKAKKGRKKSNPVVSAAKKGLGNIFDFLMGIFKDFVLYKVLDWVADPKNKEKVHQLVKFVGAIPGAMQFMWEKFVEPWWEFSKKLFGGGFKIFMSLFDVVKDVIELKWLTNPGEFFNTLMEVPKTLIEVVPGIIGSLLDAITGGAITKIGDLVGGLFNNPLKGIDLGNVGSLLGSAAGFVKGLLGNAWTGITNAVGNIFGGGGGGNNNVNNTSNRRRNRGSNGAGSTPKPQTLDTPSQPPATKPITKNSGTADLGDKNYGVKVGHAKSVELDGKKYIFTRKKDEWVVQKEVQASTSRGMKTQRRLVKDASTVSGLVAAFDKEHGQKKVDPVTSSADTESTTGPGTFIQGNTGNSRGDHFHIGPETELWGKSSGKTEARRAAFKVAKGLINKKETFWFTNANIKVDPNSPPDDQTLTKYVNQEQSAHAARSGGGSFGGLDIAGRQGLRMPIGVSDVRDRGDGFGISGTISGTRAFVGHGMAGSTTTPGVMAVQPGSAPTQSPVNAVPTSPSSGSNLGSAQQESRQLSTAPRQSQQPTVINNSSSTNATHSATETFVGGTLPKSGLWAIYSLAL